MNTSTEMVTDANSKKYFQIWLNNHILINNLSIMSKHQLGFKQNDFITMIMTSKQIPLAKVSEFLKTLSKLVSLYTGQKISPNPVGIKYCINFLSAFMIYYFPDHADCNDTHIIKLAHKIATLYTKFLNDKYPNKNDIVLFYYVTLEFNNNFIQWEHNSKIIELNSLVQLFWSACANVCQQMENAKQQIEYLQNYNDQQLELYYAENPNSTLMSPPIKYDGTNIDTVINNAMNTYTQWNQQFESGFENLKQKVSNQAYKIYGKTGTDYIKNTIPVFIDPSFTESIRKHVYNAFWHLLENDLKQTPPNYSGLINLITELKTYMMACVPNRLDIHHEINTNIDIELWKQMLNNNAFDNNTIYGVMQYVMQKIKEWSAPVYLNEIDNWSIELTKTFSNSNITSQETISSVLSFLKNSFAFLEKIIIASHKFKNTNEYLLLKQSLAQFKT